MKRLDLTGQTFGKLTVISSAPSQRTSGGQMKAAWECRCECGNQVKVTAGHLRSGHTQSCDCGLLRMIHGQYDTKLYGVWEAIIQRTTNPKDKNFHHYGGRGIGICERWRHFVNFFEDMGGGWREGLTIDRRENSKGYCKENCHWITQSEQLLNTRRTRRLTINGVTMAAKSWSRKTGIDYATLLRRLNQGWPHEEAVKI